MCQWLDVHDDWRYDYGRHELGALVDDAAAAHRMKLKTNQTVLIPCAHWQTPSAI